MELWHRLLVIGIVLVLTAAAARLIDRRIMGCKVGPLWTRNKPPSYRP